MITLEPTDNMTIAALIMRDPKVFPWISSDLTDPDWLPKLEPGTEWLLASRYGLPFGILALDRPPVAYIEDWAELHVAFRPQVRGRPVLHTLRLLWEYAARSGLRRVYASILSDNRPALRMAGFAGMRRRGVMPSVVPRGGVMRDMVVFVKEVN